MPTRTPCTALAAAVRRDPAVPLVTFVGPQGRTELSARSLDNAVAKAAGLLRDGLDVQPGDRVGLLIGAHWQSAVWLGACWATGAVAWVDPDDAAACAVCLATADRLSETTAAPERLRVSTHPFGLPSPDPLPAGVLEAAVEVRAHGDVFVPYAEPDDDDPALQVAAAELSAADVMDHAATLATALGLTRGGRLLTSRPAVDLTGVLALLAVPLAVAGSVVIAVDQDLDRLHATEATTATLA